jgi:hypothetical protein
MNKSMHYRIFHSNISIGECLSGAALLIVASDRLAHAITVFGALIWVYCLSSLTARVAAIFFPRQGRTMLLAFLCSFFVALYLLLLWILSPLCALETFFVISLIPLSCMTSGVFVRLETLSIADTFSSSASEALILGALMVIFALIREPVGYLSLSLPGGSRGMILLLSSTTESFLPIRLIVSSCGALLLLGYALQLYRYFREKDDLGEDKNDH